MLRPIDNWYSDKQEENIINILSGGETKVSQLFNLKVQVDSEGNFLGVPSKDKNGNDIVLNPAAHNRKFENKSAATDIPQKKNP